MKNNGQKRSSLQENEVRPDALQAELTASYQADLKWIQERRSGFSDCACPACAGVDRSLLFEKDGFQYQICGNCETVYISPRPSQAILAGFYEVSHVYHHFLNSIFPETKEARREHFFRPRVDRIIEASSAAGLTKPAIMEIGAAFGLFCEEAEKTRFFGKIIGVEPNREMAERCRNQGLNIIQKMVEDVLPEEVGALDVICAFEVFEHLLEPLRFLESCKNLLASGGLLFLTMPNGKGFDLSMLGALSGTYNFEHLTYFNPHSIGLLLERGGFEVVNIRTPGKMDVDLVRKAVVAGQLDLGDDSFLRQVLVEENERLGEPFQQFLADNTLSGHMEVIARVR